MRIRPILLMLVSIVVLAALAYGLRASGIWAPASTPQAQITAAAPSQQQQPQGGASGGGNRPPAPVEVAETTAQSLTDSISAIGSLVANETAEVAADSNGRIVSVSAQDGKAVKKGDELFRLDGALLQAEVADAEARMTLAEATFRRSQTLARSQSVAQAQVDQTRAELEQARSALDLVKERQRRLIVRAPFDGHLGFRLMSEGAYVTAGTPLVRIDQISTLKVSLSIPERFYSALTIGQEVKLNADAVPGKSFRARITAINPVVDVNGRALQILAVLENADLQLRPGMLARAQVLGASRQAVTVPESAVVPQGNESVIFAVKDGKAHRLKIATGLRRDGWVEVTSGLEAGATVITAGNSRLSDGAPVKPQAAKPQQ
jgi:membrane fusion protein, multidrug efflux system